LLTKSLFLLRYQKLFSNKLGFILDSSLFFITFFHRLIRGGMMSIRNGFFTRIGVQARGLHYKTFYGRNLRIFIISWSVCPWQAFPAWSNNCGWGQEPTLQPSTWKVLHSGRLWPYPQHWTRLERLARDKHSSSLGKNVNYGCKKFYSTDPRHEQDCYLISKEQGRTRQNGIWNEISGVRLFLKILLKHRSWMINWNWWYHSWQSWTI
jgi:hypothetical protein